MHKCICGTEYEGKFCPNCGTKWEEEKTCPNCGAKLIGGVRFCNECGYSFVSVQREEKASQSKAKSSLLKTLFSIFLNTPAFVYVLFSLLIFAFYSAPVAMMPGGNLMGEVIPAESYGSVFTLFKETELLSEIPDLKNGLSTLIILAVICVVYAVVIVLSKIFTFGNKQLKISTANFTVSQIISAISIVFYIIFLIAGSSIQNSIVKVDEGMGVIVAGSCPKLLVTFSIIFAILSIGAFVANVIMSIKFPGLVQEIENDNQNRAEIRRQKKEQAIIDAEQRKKDEEQKKKDEIIAKKQAFILAHKDYYDTHTEPVYSDTMTLKEQYIYKYKKKMYDNAIDGEPSKARIFVDMHKKLVAFLIVLAIFLFYCVICTSVYFSSLIRLDVVQNIQLGSTEQQVEQILGKPNYTNSDSEFTTWYYQKNNRKLTIEFSCIFTKGVEELTVNSVALEKTNSRFSPYVQGEAFGVTVTKYKHPQTYYNDSQVHYSVSSIKENAYYESSSSLFKSLFFFETSYAKGYINSSEEFFVSTYGNNEKVVLDNRHGTFEVDSQHVIEEECQLISFFEELVYQIQTGNNYSCKTNDGFYYFSEGVYFRDEIGIDNDAYFFKEDNRDVKVFKNKDNKWQKEYTNISAERAIKNLSCCDVNKDYYAVYCDGTNIYVYGAFLDGELMSATFGKEDGIWLDYGGRREYYDVGTTEITVPEVQVDKTK